MRTMKRTMQNAVTWLISRSARLTALAVGGLIKAEGITLAEFMAGYEEYQEERDKARGVSEA
jgi:hypothetical protein